MATKTPLFSHLATSAARADCLSNPWSNTKCFKFSVASATCENWSHSIQASSYRYMSRTSLRFSCRWADSAIAWARASAQGHPPHPLPCINANDCDDTLMSELLPWLDPKRISLPHSHQCSPSLRWAGPHKRWMGRSKGQTSVRPPGAHKATKHKAVHGAFLWQLPWHFQGSSFCNSLLKKLQTFCYQVLPSGTSWPVTPPALFPSLVS